MNRHGDLRVTVLTHAEAGWGAELLCCLRSCGWGWFGVHNVRSISRSRETQVPIRLRLLRNLRSGQAFDSAWPGFGPNVAQDDRGVFVASFKEGTLEHFQELCRPEFCTYPTHSAEKRGMDGAQKPAVNPKMLWRIALALRAEVRDCRVVPSLATGA